MGKYYKTTIKLLCLNLLILILSTCSDNKFDNFDGKYISSDGDYTLTIDSKNKSIIYSVYGRYETQDSVIYFYSDRIEFTVPNWNFELKKTSFENAHSYVIKLLGEDIEMTEEFRDNVWIHHFYKLKD